MNSPSNTRSGGRKPADHADQIDTTSKKTPPADMQAEDAGTPDSGNTGRGTAAESAMKQTSKTTAERDSKR